jgi:hypothetical protein
MVSVQGRLTWPVVFPLTAAVGSVFGDIRVRSAKTPGAMAKWTLVELLAAIAAFCLLFTLGKP